MSLLPRSGWIALGVALLGGCDAEAPVPQATVRFALDAPLCSSRIPVTFFIDSVQVGADTFTIQLPPDHTLSRVFLTSPGQHTVGARDVSGALWPDTVVNLLAGEVFTDSLPFYCS